MGSHGERSLVDKMRKVLAVLLVALIMLEPASSLSIQAKMDSGSSKDSGSGSSGKDGDDNTTKDEGSQASLPFSGGDADDTKKNGIAAGGAFVIGLLVGVAAVKSSSKDDKKAEGGEGEEGDKKDSSSNPSAASSPGDK